MKIILLAVTIMLFIKRIKDMPNTLSKTKYMDNLAKSVEKYKENRENSTLDLEAEKGVYIVMVFLMGVFYAGYYTLIGTRSDMQLLTALSAVQVVTICITVGRYIKLNPADINMDSVKFHRWYFLFNAVLDLVYYPLAVYALLQR